MSCVSHNLVSRALCLTALGLGLAAPGLAAPATNDVLLTLRARQALASDTALAPLNLGVSVQDATATVWGSIPSEAMRRHLLDCLRRVPGLSSVLCEGSTRRAPEDSAVLHAPEAQRPSPRAALAGRDPGERVPIAQTPRRAPTPLQEAVSLGVPAAAPAPPSDLRATVEQVRRRDPRFRRLRVEVRDRVLVLSGQVARGEDTMRLAEALARLPGVERVVIGQVQVDPPRR